MATILEVAISTLDDAQSAQAGGADRLELSAALELGGLTPSLGTFLSIKKEVALPIVVLLRPRPGGFIHTAGEFLTVQRDAELFAAHDAAALAFGFLAPDRTIDASQTRRFMRRFPTMPAVFHRAFDLTPDPMDALETLIDLGVRRVLTSGQAISAPQGAQTLRSLIDRAAGGIEVLPAAGITPQNAVELIARTGAHQLHGSFSVECHDPAEPVCPGGFRRTSLESVRAARRALDAMR